jgi:gluconolactonase
MKKRNVRLQQKQIHISKVRLSQGQCVSEVIKTGSVPMPNGGINYQSGILFCAQGTLTTPAGLAFMSASPPYDSRFLLSSFHGRPINSPTDVVVHSDGSIWFTDPIYGYEQGIRPRPQLPSQVYRFVPETGALRAVADGFGRPNGICFSPGEETVYITDTDFIHGDGGTDLVRVSSM